MLTKEEAQAEVKKHGNIAAAARAHKVARSTFQHWVKGIKDPERARRPTAGKSLADFRATHDKAFIIPARIKEGLKQLGDGWEYETGFAKMAGVSLLDLGHFRDQFSEFVVVVDRGGKRAWAGTPSVAARMREMCR